MCLSSSAPEYKEPVTMEAPEPNKAPRKLESEESVDPEKKKRSANKRGTKALRTDLPNISPFGATGTGSGLFIPRG
jgi:hypothetical protein